MNLIRLKNIYNFKYMYKIYIFGLMGKNLFKLII